MRAARLLAPPFVVAAVYTALPAIASVPPSMQPLAFLSSSTRFRNMQRQQKTEIKNDGGSPQERSQRNSVARAGGRQRKKKSPSKENARGKGNSFLGGLLLPLISLAVLLRFFFSSFISSPNVVYYSQTVYETSTYSADGKVETQRKETFESNLPLRQIDTTRIDVAESIERELENDLDDFLSQRW